MLRRVSQLRGVAVDATDGEIGHVEDVYFEDQHWTVRNVAVRTGGWLDGRRVLIPPIALRGIDWRRHRLAVALDRGTVGGSPQIGIDRRISHGDEWTLLRYYGFPYEWGGEPPRRASTARAARRRPDDPHLRSARETIGYAIEAQDGHIGHLDDYLIDENLRNLRYLIVATRDWWPGRKVLIAPDWVEWVSSVHADIHVDVVREAVRRAPEYDPSRPIDRDLERRLHEAHARPPLDEDERQAHRSQVAADQLGIPRRPGAPRIESDEKIRREVHDARHRRE
jgi:hypothetical protein